MTYRALFSCWDASATVQTGWVPNTPGYCERFGGEGTGAHCIVPITLRPGVRYAVRVAFAGAVEVRPRLSPGGVLLQAATHACFRGALQVAGVAGAAWAGTITDLSTQAVTPIGTLFHPSVPGHLGYGNLTIAAADFQEYFLSTGCPAQARGDALRCPLSVRESATSTPLPPSQAVSGVGLLGPWLTLAANSSTIVEPTQVRECYGADAGAYRYRNCCNLNLNFHFRVAPASAGDRRLCRRLRLQ